MTPKGPPPTDNDAPGKFKVDDEVQTLPEGTKTGLVRNDEVMAAFREIAHAKKS
jgi:hypothetical protein